MLYLICSISTSICLIGELIMSVGELTLNFYKMNRGEYEGFEKQS